MKTAKTLANLTALALTLGFIPGVHAQQEAQTQKPAAKAANSAKPSEAPKPAAKANSSKPAEAAKPTAKVTKAAKPAKRKGGVINTSASGPAPAAEITEPIVSRRDPFTPLVSLRAGGGPTEHLPPGKAGLVVATVRIDGAVKSPNGMIAVVSNPEQRVYFVREGDRLYDGDVEKISLEGVTFRENSKDAFGRSVERLVTKRIYSSAGEQQ